MMLKKAVVCDFWNLKAFGCSVSDFKRVKFWIIAFEMVADLTLAIHQDIQNAVKKCQNLTFKKQKFLSHLNVKEREIHLLQNKKNILIYQVLYLFIYIKLKI